MSDEPNKDSAGGPPPLYGSGSLRALLSLQRSLADLQRTHNPPHMALAGVAGLYAQVCKAEDLFRGNHMFRFLEEQRRASDRLAALVRSAGASPRFLEEQRRISDTIAASFRSANQNLMAVARDIAGIGDLSKSVKELSRLEHPSLLRISDSVKHLLDGGSVAAGISQAMRVSIAAEAAFARLHGTLIGGLVGARPDISRAISSKVMGASTAYASLARRLYAEPHSIPGLCDVVVHQPPIEMFRLVDLAQTVTQVEPEPEIEQCEEDLRQHAAECVHGALEDVLATVNPKLRELLDGAKLALHSANPDRARHVATSLRELMTHVLHTLSPDDGVKLWSSDPSYYHNDQPTRRARLLYICRRINQSEFTTFVKKDVDALLAFVDLFQQATHELTSPFTESQLEAMIHRTEAAVLFLVNTARSK